MSEVDLTSLSVMPEAIRLAIVQAALDYITTNGDDSMYENACDVASAGMAAYLETFKRPVKPYGTKMDSLEDMTRDVTRASEAAQSLIALLSSPEYLALSLDEQRNLLRQAQAERESQKTKSELGEQFNEMIKPPTKEQLDELLKAMSAGRLDEVERQIRAAIHQLGPRFSEGPLPSQGH